MENALPILGWFISFAVSVSMSIPFWFCWTICGLGKLYFYFLPERYQSIPFWHCVGLGIIISILLAIIPKIVSVKQEVTNEKAAEAYEHFCALIRKKNEEEEQPTEKVECPIPLVE